MLREIAFYMKRVLCLLFFGLIVLSAKSQTLADFNKNHTHTITYDENFITILNLTVKNVSSKEITTIELTTTYDADPYDWTTGPDQKIIQIHIYPGERGTVSSKVPPKNNKKPKQFWISKVRFSDGTICKE